MIYWVKHEIATFYPLQRHRQLGSKTAGKHSEDATLLSAL